MLVCVEVPQSDDAWGPLASVRKNRFSLFTRININVRLKKSSFLTAVTIIKRFKNFYCNCDTLFFINFVL